MLTWSAGLDNVAMAILELDAVACNIGVVDRDNQSALHRAVRNVALELLV